MWLAAAMGEAAAQAQRLAAETSDPAAAARAGEIEATLKRLTRLAERLMQLARAEGGQVARQVRSTSISRVIGVRSAATYARASAASCL